MDKKFNNIVLLITGCVTPSADMPFLVLKDPIERRKQYIDSIKFYINYTPIIKIVFCDNSNAESEPELEVLAKVNNKEFEWLSFMGNQKESEIKGKGYGEGEIIDYAIEHSRFIKKESYLVKITGRLIVKNLSLLLNHISLKKGYFFPIYKGFVDTRIYMMPKKIYSEFFINLYLHVDDVKGRYLECVFAECIKKEKIKYKRFIVAPIVGGISGTSGTIHKEDFRIWIYDTIRMYFIKV